MPERMTNFSHVFYATVEESKENLLLPDLFPVKVILFYKRQKLRLQCSLKINTKYIQSQDCLIV